MKIKKIIKDLHGKYQSDLSGDVCTSIPALGSVDPDLFAISVTTIDGQVFNIGDVDTMFTIQSISKAFSYGLALEQHGSPFLEEKVGMEPTGEDFDSIIKLDDLNRPFNPMVNSGAIVTTSLINARNYKSRDDEILKYFEKFANQKFEVDKEIYDSELNNSHKNWAIVHLLRHFRSISKDYESDLKLYIKQCSASLNIDSLSMMGATLANNGVNPITKKRCISAQNLRHMLSVIFTCGMYNYSGEWAFDVGLPAKSGVSGSILMIVPGLMAISVYSPRLDKRGNSVRGIKVCEELSQILKLHILDYGGPSRVSELI